MVNRNTGNNAGENTNFSGQSTGGNTGDNQIQDNGLMNTSETSGNAAENIVNRTTGTDNTGGIDGRQISDDINANINDSINRDVSNDDNINRNTNSNNTDNAKVNMQPFTNEAEQQPAPTFSSQQASTGDNATTPQLAANINRDDVNTQQASITQFPQGEVLHTNQQDGQMTPQPLENQPTQPTQNQSVQTSQQIQQQSQPTLTQYTQPPQQMQQVQPSITQQAPMQTTQNAQQITDENLEQYGVSYLGGGWYQLPNGEKVQGKDDALAYVQQSVGQTQQPITEQTQQPTEAQPLQSQTETTQQPQNIQTQQTKPIGILAKGPTDAQNGAQILVFKKHHGKGHVQIRSGQVLYVGQDLTEQEAKQLLDYSAWSFERMDG